MKFAKLIISLFVVISGFTFHSNAIAQAAFEKVDAFSRTVCGLREDGDVECRSTSDFDTPLPSDLPAAQDVAAGLAATCLIVADGGELLCIGTGAFGLDNPPSEGAPYQAVDVSVAHACAINRDNGIECWGLDTNDRLNAPEGQFTQLSLSQEQQGCAVDVNGGVSCWGANDQGTLDVPDDLPAALKVGTGFASSCALLEDGTIRCWGRDIPAFPGTFTDFDMQANGSAQRGSASICAIDAQGEITCRFYSYDGQDEPPVLRDDLDTFTGTGHTDISVPTFGTACSVNSSAEIECVSLFSSLSDIDLNEPLPQSASVTTGLRVLVYSATSAELIWNAPTDPFNVAGHEIQRNGEIFAFTQNSSSFLLNDLTEGEPETFAVRRVDVNGNIGGFSETISVTSVAGEPDFAPTASNFIPPERLFEESILDAFVFCSDVAELFWFSDLPSGEIPGEIDGFEIHRDGQFIAFTENDFFDDPGITEGFVHNYDVIAIDLDDPTRFHGVASAILEIDGIDDEICNL